jgi:hypothetical protein
MGDAVVLRLFHREEDEVVFGRLLPVLWHQPVERLARMLIDQPLLGPIF